VELPDERQSPFQNGTWLAQRPVLPQILVRFAFPATA
jgi:hypothetical protein